MKVCFKKDRVFIIIFLTIFIFFIKIPLAHTYFELKYTQGVTYYNQGEYKKAFLYFKGAAKENPEDGLTFYYIGLSALKLKKPKRAIKAFIRAKNLNPNIKSLYYNLGKAYTETTQYKKGIRSFKEALRRDPNNAMAYFYLAYLYVETKNYEASLPYLRAAMDRDPSLSQVSLFYMGFSFYKMGEREKAKITFQRCIQLAPETNIAEVARDYLKVIRKAVKKKKWSLYSSLSLQYDSNVILESKEEDTASKISDEDDFRFVFYLNGEYRPITNDKLTAGIDYEFYQSLHFDLSEYNLHHHAGGPFLEYKYKIVGHPSSVKGFYNFGIDFLGGDHYLNKHSAGLIWSISYGEGFATKVGYTLRYKDFYFNYTDSEDNRDGLNHSISITQYYLFPNKKNIIYAGYSFDKDVTDGDNWEYAGHKFKVGFITPLISDITLNIEAKAYFKRFDNVDTNFEKRRKDDQYTFGISLEKKITKYLRLSFKYLGRINNSNINFFEYERNIISLGIIGIF